MHTPNNFLIELRDRRTLPPTTHRQVVAAFGGYGMLGRAMGLSKATVAAWKNRGSIPPKYWDQIVYSAAFIGLDAASATDLVRVACALAVNAMQDADELGDRCLLSVSEQRDRNLPGHRFLGRRE